MPLNTLRLNHQKSSHPNDRIVFIKPLPRPPSDQASCDVADTFLRAIAAQCLPLMKNHHLSVTTLEEHEPNPEFIGRNFNNGEIIQLVLRSKNGRWVPFSMVQMVMMHELAHNTHMNHGRDFWKTRNMYAEEMKALWAKGYTGEGFWGSGRTLNDMGAVMGNNVMRSHELESLPLCGGTYRSRNRKRRGRKDKPELTWREKRDRRIERKFGENGVALGEDEDKRLGLEIQKKGPVRGKPRVAQSARGRELRAAAALARFETNKEGVKDLRAGERIKSDGSGEDDYEDMDADQEDARDVNGQKILDSQGHGMIRVCDDEAADDADAQHELQELNTLDRYFRSFRLSQEPGGIKYDKADMSARTPRKTTTTLEADTNKHVQSCRESPGKQQPRASTTAIQSQLPVSDKAALKLMATQTAAATIRDSRRTRPTPESIRSRGSPRPSDSTSTDAPTQTATSTSSPSSMITCPICSLENPRLNATCMACSHVLDPRKDPRHWSCQNEVCRSSGTTYLNAGDVGMCGVCGVRRKT